jgi:hypothetical protein
MSYVSPNSPLPPNGSTSAISACEALKACQIVNGVEQAAATGRSTVNQMAAPASFVQFGLPVAKQVVAAQTRLATANNPGLVAGSGSAVPPPTQRPRPPQVVPLNVTPAEYYGCCVRGVDPLPAVSVQSPQRRISIPAAPIPTQTAAGIIYMQPSASAFMPSVRRAASGGGGVAPIQHGAPVRRFMGYTGYKGLGAAWGNAGSGPCGPTWGSSVKSGTWLWALAVVGIGVYALGRR